MTQDQALEVMKTGVNVFLTGAPGTGKTHTINAYIEHLRSHAIEPSITASTGIAATHIGGRTIHSFIGIGVVDYMDEYVIDMIMQRETLYKKLLATKILIIDEVSMLDAKVLDKINVILKGVRKSQEAFGGVQIIFVGDFFQLPPVSKGDEIKKFAYESAAWREAKPLVCYLEKQYRQREETLSDLLLSIRNKTLGDVHLKLLEERISASQNLEEDTEITRLHTHNLNVDAVNDKKLAQIDGKAFTYEMTTTGSAARVESLQKSCLAPKELKLKVGARVMFVKNATDGSYVNGSIGIVSFLSRDTIKVLLKNGRNIEVEESEWVMEDDGKVRARLVQYPLRLAWAITVHKSQGMSLDEAVMSLGGTFEYGQGYVALSRVRSLQGLYLLDYNQIALEVHGGVYSQDKAFREYSEMIAEKLSKSDKKQVQELQDNFILKCGGTLSKNTPVKKEKENYVGDTLQVTLKYFKEGKGVDEIAKIRTLKRDTVAKHLEELQLLGELNKDFFAKCYPSLLDVPQEVKKSFAKNSMDKLTPVFKDLQEKYSFDDLRIYRMILRLG